MRALEVETKTIWEDNCYTDPKVHNLVFGSFSHALRTKTSTSKVLRSCSSQIFVNMVKKNIFELLAFLLETNLARAVTLTLTLNPIRPRFAKILPVRLCEAILI